MFVHLGRRHGNCAGLNRRDFLKVGGLTMLGLPVDPQLPAAEVGFGPLEEVVAWINEQGAVPFLAHTYWSGLRTDQFEACEGLVGIESDRSEERSGRRVPGAGWTVEPCDGIGRREGGEQVPKLRR